MPVYYSCKGIDPSSSGLEEVSLKQIIDAAMDQAAEDRGLSPRMMLPSTRESLIGHFKRCDSGCRGRYEYWLGASKGFYQIYDTLNSTWAPVFE